MRVAIAFSDRGELAFQLAEEAGKLIAGIEFYCISPRYSSLLNTNSILAKGSTVPFIHGFRLSRFAHSTEERSAELFGICNANEIDLLLLLNFWRLVNIPAAWCGRVFNCHGSLLPDFGGRGFFGQALFDAILSARVRRSGSTLHRVTSIYDVGHIVRQSSFHIDPEETVTSLRRKTERAQLDDICTWLKDEYEALQDNIPSQK